MKQYMTLDDAVEELGRGSCLALINNALKTKATAKKWRDQQTMYAKLGRATAWQTNPKPVLVPA